MDSVIKSETTMFVMTSKKQYEAFDNQLALQLATKAAGTIVFHHFLGDAFDKLSSRKDSPKLMAALLDLQINFCFIQIDVTSSVGRWNNELRLITKPHSSQSILDDHDIFATRLEILKSTSSFVVRTRSFWDKIMGFWVLYIEPEAYDKFVGAKSRKKAFKKIASEWDEMPYSVQHAIVRKFQKEPMYFKVLVDKLENGNLYPEPFLTHFSQLMERLDVYRTAETHGTGKLRKYSLSNLGLDKAFDLGIVMNSWNDARHMMDSIVCEFIQLELADFKQSPRYLNPEKHI